MSVNKKLLVVQSELKAPKSQFNSFGKYKYRNAEDILEAVKPLLKSNNLNMVVTDEVKELAGIVYIEATVRCFDEDGEVVVRAQAGVDLEKKGMDMSQRFGATSSYARKYALNGMFLIDDTKDADATNTHGNEIPTGVTKPTKQAPVAEDKPEPKKPVSDSDVKKAIDFIAKQEDKAKAVKSVLAEWVKRKWEPTDFQLDVIGKCQTEDGVAEFLSSFDLDK